MREPGKSGTTTLLWYAGCRRDELRQFRLLRTVFVLLLLVWSATANSDDSEPVSEADDRWSYGDKGLQFDDGTGNNFLWFGARVQTLATSSTSTAGSSQHSSDLEISRARLKIGGNLISPALTVYSEYDLVGSFLLDLRATIKLKSWLSIRAGQWKSEYNRERIDSSGTQQFVERSIATPWFTIDRQQAVMASGRAGDGTGADISYWLGRLSGAGRGGSFSDADGLWMTRLQWNVGGRLLKFSQSALERPELPTGSLAIAAVDGYSPYTAFSSDGGGQLPGYSTGAKDQYRLSQFMFETAVHYRGYSWQQEIHWKRIDDQISGTSQSLIGGYAQAGVFLSEWIDNAPTQFEIAARAAIVDPDRSRAGLREHEYSIVTNWFLNGHRNKLTMDLSHLKLEDPGPEVHSNRIRVQWDVSF